MRGSFTKGSVVTLLAVTLAVAVAAATPAGRTPAAAASEQVPGDHDDGRSQRRHDRTGLSVLQGRDPVSFDAEVLGILTGFPLPGRKVVIAELSGPPLDQAGGVWFGASGSPVYMDDPAGEEEPSARSPTAFRLAPEPRGTDAGRGHGRPARSGRVRSAWGRRRSRSRVLSAQRSRQGPGWSAPRSARSCA